MVRDTGPGSYFNIFYTPDRHTKRRPGKGWFGQLCELGSESQRGGVGGNSPLYGWNIIVFVQYPSRAAVSGGKNVRCCFCCSSPPTHHIMCCWMDSSVTGSVLWSAGELGFGPRRSSGGGRKDVSRPTLIAIRGCCWLGIRRWLVWPCEKNSSGPSQFI